MASIRQFIIPLLLLCGYGLTEDQLDGDRVDNFRAIENDPKLERPIRDVSDSSGFNNSIGSRWTIRPTTRVPSSTYPSKRHVQFRLTPGAEKQLHVEDELLEQWDLLATDFPLLQQSPWDYLDYNRQTDYFYDYVTRSDLDLDSILSDLSLQQNCTETTGTNGNDSVVCCTFAVENSSDSTTLCSNTTSHERERKSLCPTRNWDSFLKMVCIPVICVLGICGNTISFFVMCSGAYRRKSYGYYLRALAVFDNLTLIINLVFALNDALFEMNGPDATYSVMSHHTTLTCKLTEFMRYVVYLMSSWLVVCFTVDRFIAVCFPLLRVRYCTEKSAICTIASVLFAIMISQSYHLVFIERLDRSQNPHFPCHVPMYPDKSARLMYLGLNYFWFSFLLRFALPFIAVAFCNTCIIYHIERMKSGRQHAESRRKQKANLAIYTLYAVCACFVITLLPNAIVTIIQFSWYVRHQHHNEKLYCLLQLVYTAFQVLRLMNYAANFVLYGITGAQFRRELAKLMGCCCSGRFALDKRSIQSPEPIPLTSRRGNGNNPPDRQKLVNINETDK